MTALGTKYSEQAPLQTQNSTNVSQSKMSSRIMQQREVKLQFMDDFCKQANIFTNEEAKLKHQIDHSRKLHKVYEKSLENATKNFPVLPEVFGMNDFLKPLPRDDEEKAKKQKEQLATKQ